MSIPTYHFGLRIRATFGAQLAQHDSITPETHRLTGSGAYSDHGNPVQALAEWICPRGDGPNVRMARCISWNAEAGTMEVDCYGEYAGRVLTVLRRLGARTLDAHAISV